MLFYNYFVGAVSDPSLTKTYGDLRNIQLYSLWRNSTKQNKQTIELTTVHNDRINGPQICNA